MVSPIIPGHQMQRPSETAEHSLTRVRRDEPVDAPGNRDMVSLPVLTCMVSKVAA